MLRPVQHLTHPHLEKSSMINIITMIIVRINSIVEDSVADPDPYRMCFRPPGSGSASQRYGCGSGSFYHQAKIGKKP